MLVDVIILLILGLWGILGLKRGVVKQGVMTIGTILVYVLAFYLKNPLAEFLSLNLPFITFGGIFKGITSINIIFYQLLSFIIVVSLLQVVLNVIVKLSSALEKILKFTIILGIPSKILGFILGLVEGFVVIYIGLFFLTQPLFKLDIFNDSKLTNKVLKDIPVLSNVSKGMVNTFNDIYALTDSYYNENLSSNSFNLNAIDVMLKNKVISVEYIEKLEDKGKLEISDLHKVLDKYRGE